MAVGYRKITLGHMKIRIPFSRWMGEVVVVAGEVTGFESIDMTGRLRAEKSPKYSPSANHRHKQNVCQTRQRGHPNAPPFVGKVPEDLEIGRAATPVWSRRGLSPPGCS